MQKKEEPVKKKPESPPGGAERTEKGEMFRPFLQKIKKGGVKLQVSKGGKKGN